MMLELNPISVESSELVEQTFTFWLKDNEHIRSPFPGYIHAELKQISTQLFFNWASSLNPKAKEEVNDEIVAEKFEELIFETGLNLVRTEDEKITIRYPFLPRIDDTIFEDVVNQTGRSSVIDRELIKEGDHSYMMVKLKNFDTLKNWETKFELPI